MACLLCTIGPREDAMDSTEVPGIQQRNDPNEEIGVEDGAAVFRIAFRGSWPPQISARRMSATSAL